MKKISFTKNPAPANKIDSMTCFGTEFRLVISSGEWFGTEFRAFAANFLPWYRIPSIFLFQGMGSERNSEIFAFHGTGEIPLE